MILNTKIQVFVDFLADFGLRDTFQKQIAPQSIEIGKDKLRMKFSASLNFYVQENLHTRALKSGNSLPPEKSLFYRCWPVFRESGCR